MKNATCIMIGLFSVLFILMGPGCTDKNDGTDAKTCKHAEHRNCSAGQKDTPPAWFVSRNLGC